MNHTISQQIYSEYCRHIREQEKEKREKDKARAAELYLTIPYMSFGTGPPQGRPPRPLMYDTELKICARDEEKFEEYSVTELREFSDEEFESFKKRACVWYDNSGFSHNFPVFSLVISTLERLTLERRVKKLEEVIERIKGEMT